MKKPVVSFRIEPEQRAALDSLCAATGKDGTFHMRQALEQYLPNGGITISRELAEFLEKHTAGHCTVHALPRLEELREALKLTPVANTQRCELGEDCRCRKGDEPGCWNWVDV